MKTRDEARARKFAVSWATKAGQQGEIANLAGCYLRASEDSLSVEIALLDAIMLACGKLVPDRSVDISGQLYGISSAKEVVAAMLKERLVLKGTP